MNVTLDQPAEQVFKSESSAEQPIAIELGQLALAYVGGGMGNVAFQ